MAGNNKKARRTRDEGVYWLDDTPVYLTRKNVRNLRLRINERGEFHLSIPWRASISMARDFLHEQDAWIARQQERFARRQAAQPRLVDGETVAWWGQDVPLKVVEDPHPRARATAEVGAGAIVLHLPVGAPLEKRQRALDKLRKTSLEIRLAPVLAKWAAAFEIEPGPVRIRRMKSRWGSCNPRTRALTFNLELSSKDPKYLDYVVAHEFTHYFHPNHGPEFHALLSAKLPQERQLHRALNRRRNTT